MVIYLQFYSMKFICYQRNMLGIIDEDGGRKQFMFYCLNKEFNYQTSYSILTLIFT